jgi:molecular chaperone GrpE
MARNEDRDPQARKDSQGEVVGEQLGDNQTANRQGEEAARTAEEQLERLRADLEKANRESEEHFRLLQRAQADLVNYRRRVEQERGDVIRGAKAEVVLSVLPVLDDFERALESVPPELKEQPWVEGMALIERKLRSALDAQGVTQIEALGKQFDPWEHEAVLYEESRSHQEGEVTGVFRPGYKLQGKVIRPAQVKVAKGS